MNKAKCQFRQKKVKYCGHVISKDGIEPDPAKISAINDMPPFQNLAELRTMCDMFNYLTGFGKNMPVNDFLKKDRVEFIVADALSRQPVAHTAAGEEMETESYVKAYVELATSKFPVTDHRLEKLMSETLHDVELQQMITYVCNGWPKTVSTQLQTY
ncbi:retrovirus-related pol polyprotein from transposon opus [Plakobranchus ocellatus]|uniref:Retrovirus-related pol polyprotein from transposon opus n=1 Tax=Plakobranchus ocellatus TaxID=259542 RepID=A0AAV3Z6G0_9GAST|nr:retrovirus-related pol polyprotein from transposon opus [Plakobranchus ocellatus]